MDDNPTMRLRKQLLQAFALGRTSYNDIRRIVRARTVRWLWFDGFRGARIDHRDFDRSIRERGGRGDKSDRPGANVD